MISEFKKGSNAGPMISDIYLNTKRNFKKIRLASIDCTEATSAMKTTFLNSKKSSIGEIVTDSRKNMNRTMLNFNES